MLPSLKIPLSNHKKTINNILNRLCADLKGKVRPFTPHDLRSTARSHLSVLGVNVVVAERCLNHSLGGLLAIYDVHDYLDERRDARPQRGHARHAPAPQDLPD